MADESGRPTTVGMTREYQQRLAEAANRTGWSQREIVEMALDAFALDKLPTKAELMAELMKRNREPSK